MGQTCLVANDIALDTVITNALIVDAMCGITKADIGIRVGRKLYMYSLMCSGVALYHCHSNHWLNWMRYLGDILVFFILEMKIVRSNFKPYWE